jgi:hypothetical protein
MKKPQNSSTISKEIVNEISSNLQSLLSSRYKSNKYLKAFDQMTDATKIFVVEEILQSESYTIAKAINDCKTVLVPSLGSFKYHPSRKKALEITSDILNSYGFKRINDIKDEVLKAKIISEIKATNDKVLLADYYANHGNNINIVLSGFKIPDNV